MIVALAVQAATAADDLAAGVRLFTSKSSKTRPERLPDPPPLDIWLRMYHRHRQVSDGVGAAFGLPAKGEGAASWWLDMQRQAARDPDGVCAELSQLSKDETREVVKLITEPGFPI